MSNEDAVILSAVRTAVGKFQGALSEIAATQLGATVVREAVKRAGLKPEQIDECIMGNVLPAGLGQNPARQAAIFGGLANEVSALTINKVCGSSLKAVALAAQQLQADAELLILGPTPHDVEPLLEALRRAQQRKQAVAHALDRRAVTQEIHVDQHVELEGILARNMAGGRIAEIGCDRCRARVHLLA